MQGVHCFLSQMRLGRRPTEGGKEGRRGGRRVRGVRRLPAGVRETRGRRSDRRSKIDRSDHPLPVWHRQGLGRRSDQRSKGRQRRELVLLEQTGWKPSLGARCVVTVVALNEESSEGRGRGEGQRGVRVRQVLFLVVRVREDVRSRRHRRRCASLAVFREVNLREVDPGTVGPTRRPRPRRRPGSTRRTRSGSLRAVDPGVRRKILLVFLTNCRLADRRPFLPLAEVERSRVTKRPSFSSLALRRCRWQGRSDRGKRDRSRRGRRSRFGRADRADVGGRVVGLARPHPRRWR